MNIGDLFIEIGADLTNLRTGLSLAVSQTQSAAAEMQGAMKNAFDTGNNAAQKATEGANKFSSALKDVSRIAQGIVISQMFYSAVNAIQNAAGAVMDFSMKVENAQIAFTTMLGSAQQAGVFIQALKSYAAGTPFTFEQVQTGAQRLLAFGFEAKSVLPILTQIGDASAGLGLGAEGINRITLALGQMKTKGRVQGGEMMQLTEAGIPAWDILAKAMGKTTAEIMKMSEKGLIPAGQAINALLEGMHQKYGGLMDKLQNSTQGILSTIGDDSKIIGTDLFAGPLAGFKNFITSVRDHLDTYRKVIETSGVGGLFEYLVPKNIQPEVRMIIGSLQSLYNSIKQIAIDLLPVFKGAWGNTIAIMSAIMPAIATIVNGLAHMVTFLTQNKPLMEGLSYAISGLIIARFASVWTIGLVNAIRALSIAGIVGTLVDLLRKSITALTLAMERNPIVLVISVVVMALMGLAMSSDFAQKKLEGLMARLGQLAGFNIGQVAQPGDTGMADAQKAMEQYNGSLKDAEKTLEGTGMAADQAGKKVKGAGNAAKSATKDIMSFDEVFRIQEKDKTGNSDPGAGGGGAGGAGSPFHLPTGPILGNGGGSGGGGGGGGNFPNLPMFPKAIDLPSLKWPPGAGPDAVVAGLEGAMASIKQWAADLPGGLAPVWGKLKSGLNEVNDAIGSMLGKLNSLNPALQPIAQTIVATFTSMLTGINGTTMTMWPQIVTSWQTYFSQIPLIQVPGIQAVYADWKKWLQDMQGSLDGQVPVLDVSWSGLFNGLKTAGLTFEGLLTGDWTAFVAGILATLVAHKPTIETAWNTMMSNLRANFEPIRVNISTNWNEMINNMEAHLSSHAPVINGIWGLMTGQVNTDTLTLQAQIQGIVSGIRSNVENEFESLKQKAEGIFGSMVGSVVGTLNAFKTDVIGGFNSLWAKVVEIWDNLWADVKDKWANDKVSLILEILGGVALIVGAFTGVDEIGGIFAAAWAGVRALLKKMAPEAVPFIEDFIGSFKLLPSRIVSFFDELPGKISGILGNIGTTVSSWASNIGTTISNFFSGIKAPSLPNFSVSGGIDASSIPGYATGGIITREHFARVGEGGRQEAIIPLQNSKAMQPFADAVASALSSIFPGGGGGAGGDTLMVGTLIADDRSLKELERRMRVVRIQEDTRRGG